MPGRMSEGGTGSALATVPSGASERFIEATDFLTAYIDSFLIRREALGRACLTLAASSGHETARCDLEKTDSSSRARGCEATRTTQAFVMFNCDYIEPGVDQLHCRIV
jgi:hypothetical protein